MSIWLSELLRPCWGGFVRVWGIMWLSNKTGQIEFVCQYCISKGFYIFFRFGINFPSFLRLLLLPFNPDFLVGIILCHRYIQSYAHFILVYCVFFTFVPWSVLFPPVIPFLVDSPTCSEFWQRFGFDNSCEVKTPRKYQHKYPPKVQSFADFPSVFFRPMSFRFCNIPKSRRRRSSVEVKHLGRCVLELMFSCAWVCLREYIWHGDVCGSVGFFLLSQVLHC